MWKNHRSVFNEHIIYVKNDIQKPFKMVVTEYSERVRESFGLARYLSTPIRKN